MLINNCTISSIRQVLNETRVLVADTYITNSSRGVVSGYAVTEMINVEITGCGASSLHEGNLTVRGILEMNHSSLQVKTQVVSLESSQVVLHGAPQSSESLAGF